jgi:hypothetical protein
MNPFLLPLRQKTTVEVDVFAFAGGRLEFKSAEIVPALRPLGFSKFEYSSHK